MSTSDQLPAGNISVWCPDPLDKVFSSTTCPGKAARRVKVEAAGGEVVSAQIALRAEEQGVGLDSVAVSPMRRRGGGELPATVVERRWVGYSYVPEPASGVDPSILEGNAPGFYPDPLYPVHETATNPHHFNPDHSLALAVRRTRALWLTIRVPRSARPGLYRGSIGFKLSFWGDVLRVPISLTVHDVRLPSRPTCGVENWFTLASMVRQHECTWFSDRFWELTEKYIRNLVDHRQTHLVIPMFELIEFQKTRGNRLQMKWERFDRFVALALRCGISTLVGNHLATYTYRGHHQKSCGVHVFAVKDGAVRYGLHEGRTREAAAWLGWFLPGLRRHLDEMGWLDRWWQHIRDEPHGVREDYLAIWRHVKKHAPEFKTIEALNTPVVDSCDCWVPLLNALETSSGFFDTRRAAGDQVWTYVACGPTGRYANRFIDQKSILPRLIFWFMVRFNATGYLHWGYNWADVPHPEVDSTMFLPVQGPVQSGDVCVVYPGPHGPHDSIRWELQREGLQDYELLRMLEKRDPELLADILAMVMRDGETYHTGPSVFRAARHALLEALASPRGCCLRSGISTSWPRPVSRWKVSPVMEKRASLADVRCPAESASAEWDSIGNTAGSGVLNIHERYGDRDGYVFFTNCFVVGKSSGFILKVGHDGGVKIFIDRKARACVPERVNPIQRNRTTVPLRLSKGTHEVTVALDTDHGFGWGIAVSLELAFRKGSS